MKLPLEETGTRPAPGRLALVQAFVNTRDLDADTDLLVDPHTSAEWLARHRLLDEGARISPRDHDRIIAVREALRSIAAKNVEGTILEFDSLLEEVADSASLTLRMTPTGLTLVPGAEGVAAALGTLLAICYEAIVDGRWFAFKACHNDECRWIFYDDSKNRTGKWCRAEICGNRIRARRFRNRPGNHSGFNH
jgi:predicted RNA-binding Zn ribbon-like protein